MTEQSLFNQPEDDNIQIDLSKNYLEDLVGEGKKFKTPEDLAKGKFMSDFYIQTLERRLDAMREDYTKVLEESQTRAKLEELIDKISLQTQQPSSRTEPNTNEDINNRPTITPEQIESLVSNSIAKLDSTRKEQENYNNVLGKVRERFGNGYKEVLKTQAEQLGLTDDDVNQMARRNPNLFFKTFDINTQSNDSNLFQAPPTSQMRKDNFNPRTEKRTLSYYEKMRKEQPKLYLDPKIAIQMDRDAQELGSAFFDI